MRVNPLRSPMSGEHDAGVEPTLSPNVQDHWNRRLNLYTGRALSDGNDPTTPALHCAITSSGPDTMNSGAPTTGMRRF